MMKHPSTQHRQQQQQGPTMQRSGLSSINLSSLSLGSVAASTTSSENGSDASLSRGWGSTESRQAYGDLSAMFQEKQQGRPSRSPAEEITSNDEGSWGYFVDTPPDH